ncbi:hypothetical protein LAM67_27390, partial [Mycobacterium tuberculosis]|nr:hypothetical protein [Mycobacterium tuberculosis]
ADLQLQPVRDRALALRAAADRYAPAPAAVPAAATSGAQGSAGDAPSAAQGAAKPNGKPANAPRDPAVRRVRPCEQDAACEHA